LFLGGKMMKKVLVLLTVLAMASIASADLNMSGADFAAGPPNGWMNVTHYADSSAWGSAWGVPDLRQNIIGGNLVLQTSTSATVLDGSDPYWAPGENIMEANGYYESGWGEFTGQNVYFTFEVLSNNLAGAIGTDGQPIITEAFIKTLDAGGTWATTQWIAEPLTVGVHTMELIGVDTSLANPSVQVGFRVQGGNDFAGSSTADLSVVISTVPEPMTIGLLGLGGLLLRRRRA